MADSDYQQNGDKYAFILNPLDRRLHSGPRAGNFDRSKLTEAEKYGVVRQRSVIIHWTFTPLYRAAKPFTMAEVRTAMQKYVDQTYPTNLDKEARHQAGKAMLKLSDTNLAYLMVAFIDPASYQVAAGVRRFFNHPASQKVGILDAVPEGADPEAVAAAADNLQADPAYQGDDDGGPTAAGRAFLDQHGRKVAIGVGALLLGGLAIAASRKA